MHELLVRSGLPQSTLLGSTAQAAAIALAVTALTASGARALNARLRTAEAAQAV